jgi:metallo-beta-lactamase family protein
MQITCLGAARCVTGSNFLIDNGRKYLVDCGLFQGGSQMEALNHGPWGFSPADIDAIFLTHAHIDHSGRIPKLVKDGFKGTIYASTPTIELTKILLMDSAHIHEMEAEWQTRKNKRRGAEIIQPLYQVSDAKACFPLFETVKLDEIYHLTADFSFRFRNAGHILGASFLEIWDGPPEGTHKTVFSGDLGHKRQLIVEDPEVLTEADALFIESTYGNRNHKSLDQSEQELLEAIRYSYSHGEKVLIPAFAVERTQELLFILGKFFRENLIPSMPVYLDSPLAIAATTIFRNMKQYYDEETRALLDSGNHPFDFDQLVFTPSALESMEINRHPGAAIVIAGNGMCTAGRIKHHLKHNLWRRGCSLVIVGFQAAGSLGRSLVERARMVRVLGERVIVRAKIFTIGALSSHADQNALIEWLSYFKNPKMRVYVIHGEQSVSEEFANILRQKFPFPTQVPSIGDRITAAGIQRASAAAVETKGPTWRAYISNLAQKAEVLGKILANPDLDLPPNVLRGIEEEMISAQAHLEAALQSAEARKEADGLPACEA